MKMVRIDSRPLNGTDIISVNYTHTPVCLYTRGEFKEHLKSHFLAFCAPTLQRDDADKLSSICINVDASHFFNPNTTTLLEIEKAIRMLNGGIKKDIESVVEEVKGIFANSNHEYNNSTYRCLNSITHTVSGFYVGTALSKFKKNVNSTNGVDGDVENNSDVIDSTFTDYEQSFSSLVQKKKELTDKLHSLQQAVETNTRIYQDEKHNLFSYIDSITKTQAEIDKIKRTIKRLEETNQSLQDKIDFEQNTALSNRQKLLEAKRKELVAQVLEFEQCQYQSTAQLEQYATAQLEQYATASDIVNDKYARLSTLHQIELDYHSLFEECEQVKITIRSLMRQKSDNAEQIKSLNKQKLSLEDDIDNWESLREASNKVYRENEGRVVFDKETITQIEAELKKCEEELKTLSKRVKCIWVSVTINAQAPVSIDNVCNECLQ